MKLLAILIIYQGLNLTVESITQLRVGNYFKFGSYYLNGNFYFIGIAFGVWLLLTGLGAFLKKRFSYYSIIIAYSLLSVYCLIALVYCGLIENASWQPVVILITEIALFLIFIRYTHKNKSFFYKL